MKKIILLILLLPFNAMAQDDAACLQVLKAGLQSIVDGDDKSTMYFDDRFSVECEATPSLNILSEQDEELKRLVSLLD